MRVGERFGQLTVIELAGKSKNGTNKWLCRCDCGEETVKFSTQLNAGKATRCRSCFKKSVSELRTSHGMTQSPEYFTWKSMIARCTNPKATDYHLYGGRGITVCDRWHSFEAFYADMGARPEGMTLDRKDGNKGYCKSNCRWADAVVQANNRRQHV